MAEVNWNLATSNPVEPLPYAMQIMKIRDARRSQDAQQAAGKRYAAGDLRGAADTLAQSGDFEGATTLSSRQDALDKSHYEFAGKSARLLNQIYDQQLQAGKTPEEASAAVMQGYDTLAGTLPAAFGSPEQMQMFRQRLAQDTKGTLNAVAGMVQQKLTFQKDGQGRIIALDESTGQQVGQPVGNPEIKAPQRQTRIDGDVTIEEQFDPQSGAYKEISRGPRYKPSTGDGGARGFKEESQLRREFNNLPDVKAFNDVANSYQIIGDIAKQPPSAQNDLSLIFAYMKMLDPGSVVREGEFANAQNTAGIPDRILNLYNNARTGQRLNDNQRKEFTRSAQTVYQSRKKRADELVKQYQGFARERGLGEGTISGRGEVDVGGGSAPSKPSVSNW